MRRECYRTYEKLVIGKSIKSLPRQYKAQPKIWIDTEIFTDSIKHLDRKFLAQNRKVMVIVDNYPAHPDVLGLTGIGLIFFTAKIQSQ